MTAPKPPPRPPPRRSLALLLALAVVAVPLAACGDGGASSVIGPDNDRGGEGVRRAPAAPAKPAFEPKPTLVNHGPRSARRVALTFDADMTPTQLADIRSGAAESSWYDRRIVAELRRTRTPATIFMAGLWAQAHPGPARELARSKLFELENHSLTHAAFSYPCYGLEDAGSKRNKRREVVESSAAIERVTGVRPRYFRFPGGCQKRADLRLVAAAGEQPLGWDVVSGDVAQTDPDVLVKAVLDQVKPGSIVVMHLVGAPNAPATAEALPEIIPALRERGYELVTLERLLGTTR